MYRRIDRCRACGNSYLELLLDLGEQALTGVFPQRREQTVGAGPLRLVKCHGEKACNLVQLEHSFEASEMYGENYGYRSGLNASMVSHLQSKVQKILDKVELPPHAIVLDIGSNDGTTLSAYPASRVERIGIDPTAAKFRAYYPPGVHVVVDLFSEKNFRSVFPDRNATVVTSIAMFYDLEDPLAFMREVHRVLDENGVWVFEQSYLPLMLERVAYDTVCHEHIEYYSMANIDWMAKQTGFKIIDVEINDINGGSFSVMVAKQGSAWQETAEVARILEQERKAGVAGLEIYAQFAKKVTESREQLRRFVADAKAEGKTVAGLGASTKGNVILQYCGLGPSDIVAIGEVNEEKFGAFTPGTLIPIRPESDVIKTEYDYLIVLPWHFRETFMRKRQKLVGKTKLVFPLPTFEIV